MVRRFERAGAKTDTAPKQYRTTSRVIKTSNKSPSKQEVIEVKGEIGPVSAGVKIHAEDSISVLGKACLWIGGTICGVYLIKNGIDLGANWIKKKTTGEGCKVDTPKEELFSAEDYVPPKPEPFNAALAREVIGGEELIGNLIRAGADAVIFSPTGQGKSELSAQFGIETAKGIATQILPSGSTPKPQTVLYFDAEQEDYDMQERYGGYHYPDNLIRIPGVFKDKVELFRMIEDLVQKLGSQDVTVIIDNITAYGIDFDAEKARQLYILKKKIQDTAKTERHQCVTFITVAHSNKIDGKSTVSLDNLFGSANNSNLATTVLALCPTNRGEHTKYIKVLKNRQDKPKEGENDELNRSETAIVIERKQKPYVHFEFVEKVDEQSVILNQRVPRDSSSTPQASQQRPAPNQKVDDKCLKKMQKLEKEGKSYTNIAEIMELDRKTVSEYLNGKRTL